MYTLARSMRLFPTALSPHSLTSPAPMYAGLRYEASASGPGSDPELPTSSPSPSQPSLMRHGISEDDDEDDLHGEPGPRRQDSSHGR